MILTKTILSTEEKPNLEISHSFNQKYKIILKCDITPTYMEKIDWINLNSKGSVDIRFTDSTFDIAFENTDDAIIFKIKFSS